MGNTDLQLIIHLWRVDIVNQSAQNVKRNSHMEIKFIPINHDNIQDSSGDKSQEILGIFVLLV